MFEIEIKEGHDCSSYFWIRPVRVEPKDKITWKDVEEMEEEISIEESDVECFLAYFFYKHFDKELLYNKNRYEWSEDEFITHFEWWLTDNFYTYERMRNMLEDITQTALMLKYDYDNPSLQEVKKEFSVYYMCERNSEDYRDYQASLVSKAEVVRKNIGVVIDFYFRFVRRMYQMMRRNPDAFLISIEGP